MLLNDAAALKALNLEIGSGPRTGSRELEAFQNFKAESAARKAKENAEKAKKE